MYDEEDVLPLSGLQHMVFCDRQAALIHVEGVWAENSLTVEGGHLHRVVDEGGVAAREGVRNHRGVRLASRRLGLAGRADVVEFRRSEGSQPGVDLDGDGVRWRPIPVEYKRGKPKSHRADEVQLCAQAICLEEHFGIVIPEGSLFYGSLRRRTAIAFEPELRGLVADTAAAFHTIVRSGQTPIRQRQRKCERCSLLSVCLPPRRRTPASAMRHTRSVIAALDDDAPS